MFDEFVTLTWPEKVGKDRAQNVFARVESVGRAEFFAAAQTGLKPQYKLTVWADEYNGEPVVALRGRRYAVYRTYYRNDQKVELYLTEKAGVH